MSKWSNKFNSCVCCKKTERSHQAKGLCTKCYLLGDEKVCAKCNKIFRASRYETGKYCSMDCYSKRLIKKVGFCSKCAERMPQEKRAKSSRGSYLSYCKTCQNKLNMESHVRRNGTAKDRGKTYEKHESYKKPKWAYEKWNSIRQRFKVCSSWQKYSVFRDFCLDTRPSEDHEVLVPENKKRVMGPNNHKWKTNEQHAIDEFGKHFVEFRGKYMCLSEFARICGMPYSTVWSRHVQRRWDPEKIFRTPSKSYLIYGDEFETH